MSDRVYSVLLKLPPWDVIALALPRGKEELLESLQKENEALPLGAAEFIDKAFDRPLETRRDRYESLAKRTTKELSESAWQYTPDDLIIPLCTMWYYACKILFDVGMPMWDMDWVNSCYRSDETEALLHEDREPEPFVLSWLHSHRDLEHRYYTRNPLFQWRLEEYSWSSEFERLPTDYAREFLSALDSLVMGIKVLGPGFTARLSSMIDEFDTRYRDWTHISCPSDPNRCPLPMCGGFLFDERLRFCAIPFMHKVLLLAQDVAVMIKSQPGEPLHFLPHF